MTKRRFATTQARHNRLLHLSLLTICWLPACSLEGFFYQPTRDIRSTAASFGADVEEVHFAAASGPRLHAWWMPAKRESKGTVVFCHGNYGNLTHHAGSIAWLPGRGYNVLIFDYRGYGRSEGEVTREGTVADAIAAVDLALRRDPERTVLFGHSLGGAIAVAAAARRQRVRAVIAVSTFASYREMARAKAPYVGPLSSLAISGDLDAEDALPDIPPRPLLVVHGTADEVVPFELGKALYDRALRPKNFVEFAGGGHTLPPGDDLETFASLVCEFIDAALAR